MTLLIGLQKLASFNQLVKLGNIGRMAPWLRTYLSPDRVRKAAEPSIPRKSLDHARQKRRMHDPFEARNIRMPTDVVVYRG